MLPEKNEFPIIQIEIAKIKFLNPRTRNKVVHEEIKESIKKRGLSKPISVRAIDEGDFKYALICGQGRIEALVALGETWICPYISRHLLSLNPLQARCRRYSRGER
ncbi:ParB N-terminal domain-containing protein [Escherichia coli]|nr:ParB N-terminal domain-containing protein [Escherichia coli]MCD9391427.1 ParB N-terminal domain-containing protein [Escherichia coli]